MLDVSFAKNKLAAKFIYNFKRIIFRLALLFRIIFYVHRNVQFFQDFVSPNTFKPWMGWASRITTSFGRLHRKIRFFFNSNISFDRVIEKNGKKINRNERKRNEMISSLFIIMRKPFGQNGKSAQNELKSFCRWHGSLFLAQSKNFQSQNETKREQNQNKIWTNEKENKWHRQWGTWKKRIARKTYIQIIIYGVFLCFAHCFGQMSQSHAHTHSLLILFIQSFVLCSVCVCVYLWLVPWKWNTIKWYTLQISTLLPYIFTICKWITRKGNE